MSGLEKHSPARVRRAGEDAQFSRSHRFGAAFGLPRGGAGTRPAAVGGGRDRGPEAAGAAWRGGDNRRMSPQHPVASTSASAPAAAAAAAAVRASRWRAALAGLALAVAGASALAAEAVGPGQPLPPLALADQHDAPWRVEPGTRLLVFAADKAASDLAAEALGADGAQRLAAQRALYLADIHAMPALVTRMFALPALRALPYRVGLARDAAQAAGLPSRRGQVTLLELDADGRVGAVAYAADVATLRARLGTAPR